MFNHGLGKLIALFMLLFSLSFSSYTQIMHGGKPIGFSQEVRAHIPTIQMPAIDIERIKAEDANNENMEKVFKFAHSFEVEINPNFHGNWEEVKGGRIWRVAVQSSGAYSLNFGFNEFYLPEGGKLFIYNQDKTDYIGALTHENNKPQGFLSTTILTGDYAIIEYFEPNEVRGQARLNINRVSHDYANIANYAMRAFGSSGSCNMNVNCPDGDPWQVEKRSVAMIIAGGSRACTGSLIADYPQSNTPYFLTANHCWSSQAATEAWVFMFNYESPNCTNVDGPTNQTVSNCTFRSRNPDSDFLLVELSALPPQSYNPYISGFDKSGDVPTNTVGIHHPSGDIKKISFDDDAPGSGNMGTAVANAEWQIYAWDRSTTTEPGSSGSGLWDQNHRLVGQLHGGQATCSNSINDYYGKVSVSWDRGGASNNQLKDWLDPSNNMTTTNTVDGYDPYAPTVANDASLNSINQPSGTICEGSFTPEVVIQNKGTNNLTAVIINYDLDGGASQTYSWTGNLATNETATVALNTMTAGAGAHTFNASTSMPNGTTDENTANDNNSSAFTALASTAGTALPFTEGFENATFPPTGWTLDNPNNNATWSRETAASGFGNSTACAKMDFWSEGNDITGQSDFLNLPTLDLSGVSSPVLMDFALAYARYGNNNYDSLIIHVSTDCGANWSRVYADGNSGLATVADQTTVWTATAGDWTNKSVNLDAYQGQSGVMIRLEAKSNWGNNLFLDDINIYGTPAINADFTADVTSVCPGSTVTFTDASSGSPTSWSWTFNGGTPASSTDQNPTVVYNTSGTYDVTLVVSDGTNSDTETKTNYITVFDAPTTSTTSTNITCNGNNDGTATTAPSGGTSPYSYLWDDANAQTTATATGLGAGTYNITVTDANGCSTSDVVTITEPIALSGTTSSTDATCGNSDGTATVTAVGGTTPYTYVWDDTNAQTTATATGLSAGTYNVTITDGNGCTATATATVNDGAAPTVSTSSTDATCFGVSDGTATATVSGGTPSYTYLWDDANAQTTPTASGLGAGTYNVTVTDANGCSSSASVTITEPAEIILTTTTNDVTCSGNGDGNASVNATGGSGNYTYQWDDANMQTTSTASNLIAGTYSVIVTDDNSCSATTSVTINEPSALTAITSSTDITCNGSNDGTGTTTVSGGTGSYSYLWDDVNAQTTATANNLSAGTYTVTISDQNGCNLVETVVINEPSVITATLNNTNPSCAGSIDGSIEAVATGGTGNYSYLWDDANTQTTATANNLSAGTYSVSITDQNGCTITESGTLVEPTSIDLTTSSVDADCGTNNGEATVSATGGSGNYTYLWNDPNTQTTATATNLLSGTYDVTVTDDNGCSNSSTVSVNANGFSVSTTANNVSCNGANDGNATASPSGGTSPYTYLWDDANAQSTATAVDLSAGNYNVLVTDNNGCSSSGTITITEPAIIDIVLSVTDASCGNADGVISSVVSGGDGNYTYLWDDINSQTTADASNLAEGVYTLTVNDGNGCTNSASATVGNNSFTLSTTSNDVSCFGNNDGNATVTVSGGTSPFTYGWDDPFTQNTATAIDLSAGTYTVTVTDDTGCQNTISVTINEPNELTASATSSDATCGANNGMAIATVNGGTSPYTYLWDDANAQTTATATGLNAGTYMVTVTDNNGCITNSTVIVNNNEPVVSVSGNDVSCAATNDGSATATVTGGTSPYTYTWDDANTQTTATATSLSAGTYNVTVTDANGCIATESVIINSGSGMTLSMSSTDASCGGNDGSASVSVSGGVASYTYLWSDGNAQTTSTASNLPAGTYTVEVTDANGCTEVGTVVVNNTVPDVTITSTDPSCNGANNGSATADATGGTSPYDYQWDDGLAQNSATATNLLAGTYNVTVTDANGCTATSSVTLVESANMDITTLSNDVSCDGLCDGYASVSITGGTSPYTYAWDDANNTTTANVNDLCMGTYNVIITDANGCQGSSSVVISKPASINISANGNDINCFGNSDGYATTTITGGTAPYTYTWDDANAQSTSTATDLPAGTYTVIVTDLNGCQANATVTISEPSAISLSSTSTPDTCGSAVGTAMIAATGGAGSYTYSWATIPTNSDYVTDLSAGDYDVTVIDANGCTESTIITVDQLGGPTVNVSADQEICEGNSAAISATGGNSYYWSTGQNSSTILVTPSTTSSYWVVAIDNYGCYSDTTYSTVTVSTPPTTLITADQTICLGDSVMLEASGGTSFNWNTGATTQSITVAPSATTTYSAITSNGSCQGTAASTTVTVVPSPSVTASSDVTTTYLNEGGEVNFSGSTSGGDQITWDFGDGFMSSSLNYTHQYGEIGTYTATLTVSNGYCEATDEIEITVLQSSGIENLEDFGISLYPNPSEGLVFIQLPENQSDVYLSIYNAQGKLITNQLINGAQSVDMNIYPSGVYHFSFEFENQIINQKVLLVK